MNVTHTRQAAPPEVTASENPEVMPVGETTQHQQWSEEFEGTGVGTVRLSLIAVGSA
jgi:hypothetical protein